jgi:predicted ATPase
MLYLDRHVLSAPDSKPLRIAAEKSVDDELRESRVFEEHPRIKGATDTVAPFIRGWRDYHFQKTASTAPVRQQQYIDDNRYLHSDGRNLAPYLHMLRQVERPYYDRIVGAFRLAAPWFDDFVIEPLELRPEDVKLDWRERGREKIFGPHDLSDGSLRTIALFTLLLQPEDRLPSLTIIDEPELGLHPYAITMLAELLRSASVTTQVVVATQSVTLLNHFAPREIVTVERDGEGGTTFLRQSEERLAEWLERYSVGELWEKNVLGGRP